MPLDPTKRIKSHKSRNNSEGRLRQKQLSWSWFHFVLIYAHRLQEISPGSCRNCSPSSVPFTDTMHHGSLWQDGCMCLSPMHLLASCPMRGPGGHLRHALSVFLSFWVDTVQVPQGKQLFKWQLYFCLTVQSLQDN